MKLSLEEAIILGAGFASLPFLYFAGKEIIRKGINWMEKNKFYDEDVRFENIKNTYKK